MLSLILAAMLSGQSSTTTCEPGVLKEVVCETSYRRALTPQEVDDRCASWDWLVAGCTVGENKAAKARKQTRLAASAPIHAVTGSALKATCQAPSPQDQQFCVGFVSGVASIYQSQQDGAAIFDLKPASGVCIPSDMTSDTLVSITVSYLARNPDEMRLTADLPVGRALREAFPCGKSS